MIFRCLLGFPDLTVVNRSTSRAARRRRSFPRHGPGQDAAGSSRLPLCHHGRQRPYAAVM